MSGKTNTGNTPGWLGSERSLRSGAPSRTLDVASCPPAGGEAKRLDPSHPAALPITRGPLSEFPHDPIACMRRLHAEHGDIAALEEQGQRILFVFSPEHNQRVLSDAATFHSRFFTLRGPRRSAQRRLTSGLLSMNGSEHREHRRLVMGPFQKKTLETYREAVCRLTDVLLDEWDGPAVGRISNPSVKQISSTLEPLAGTDWKSVLQGGQVRDLHADMTQFMLRVTSGLLFGLDRPELAYRLGEMIDRWVHLNHETGIGAFVSDSRCTENYDRLLGLADELEVDIREMIDHRRAGSGEGRDVLSLLIRANEEEGRVAGDELIGHAALLFGAAHLTTAHTLTWTLFLLAQHPEIARDVVEEIAGTLAGGWPTQDDTTRLPRLDRVIKESMRVLPASSYSQRITAAPVELGPFHLPAGTPLVFSQFITHHRADLYPDPEAFRPERWLEIAPSPYAYLPFGAGPRMCLGGPLAMTILKTVLPMVLRRYRLTLVPDSEINGQVVSTMLGPTTAVPVQIAPQDCRFESRPVTGNIHDLVRLPSAAGARRAA